MDDTFKPLAEMYMGGVITDSEWQTAKPIAEQKLHWITGYCGYLIEPDAKTAYTAQLVAETVKAARLNRYTIITSEMNEEKRNPSPKREAPSQYNLIVSHG